MDSGRLSFGAIYRRLHRHHGPQGWWPLVPGEGRLPRYDPASRPPRGHGPRAIFEIGVGALLVQRMAWSTVATTLARLATADALHPAGLLALSPPELHELIRPCGTYRRKANALTSWARWCLHHAGAVPDRRVLLDLPGFGPETADSLLVYGHDQPRFIADAYARRLLSRTGLLPPTAARAYEPTRQHMEAHLTRIHFPLDPERAAESHALIVAHAKTHCRPTPLCPTCPLVDDCPTGRRTARNGEAS